MKTVWKKIFKATWDTYKSRFGPLINNIRQHGILVQNQATLSHIEDFRRVGQAQDLQIRSVLEKLEAQRILELSVLQDLETRRYRELMTWLESPNVENDLAHHSKIFRDAPDTGRWLLRNQFLQQWLDPQYPTIPPLLWMNGLPGAGMHLDEQASYSISTDCRNPGKTVLSSLVIREIQDMNSSPTLLYFFCKHGDRDRDNFVSLGRSFLSQLLQSNAATLVPFYYEEYSKSREGCLATYATIQTLLEIALLNCLSVYIIIDGIDECARPERRGITQWFRDLVESLESPREDRVHCLFVSQDDGIARKDFADLQTLRIEKKDTKPDIQKYSLASAAQIQHDLKLTDDLTRQIADKVQEAADGKRGSC
jgi:hypothetical protein